MGMMCAGASSCISVGEMFLRFVASRCEFVDNIYAGSYAYGYAVRAYAQRPGPPDAQLPTTVL